MVFKNPSPPSVFGFRDYGLPFPWHLRLTVRPLPLSLLVNLRAMSGLDPNLTRPFDPDRSTVYRRFTNDLRLYM